MPTETVIPVVPPNTSEAATLPQPPPLFAADHRRARRAPPLGDARRSHPRRRRRSAHGEPVPGRQPDRPARAARPLGRRAHDASRDHHGPIVGAARRPRRARDLARDWVEPGVLPAGTIDRADGPARVPAGQLTAVAGADVAWAATYDAVVDRFAFHDDLAGRAPAARRSPTSSSAGGRTRPSTRCQRRDRASARYERRMEELAWDVPIPIIGPAAPGAGDAAVRAPPRALCGVTRERAPDRKPDPALIEVGVGGSGFGAFAALLADGTADAQRDASSARSGGVRRGPARPHRHARRARRRRRGPPRRRIRRPRPAARGPGPDRVADGDPFHASTPAAAPAAAPPPRPLDGRPRCSIGTRTT